MRAAVQCYELLPFKLESYRHCGSLWSRTGISVTGNVQDFRVLENRSIEVRSLFRVTVKPQKWSYFLHVSPLICTRLHRRERTSVSIKPFHPTSSFLWRWHQLHHCIRFRFILALFTLSVQAFHRTRCRWASGTCRSVPGCLYTMEPARAGILGTVLTVHLRSPPHSRPIRYRAACRT